MRINKFVCDILVCENDVTNWIDTPTTVIYKDQMLTQQMDICEDCKQKIIDTKSAIVATEDKDDNIVYLIDRIDDEGGS